MVRGDLPFPGDTLPHPHCCQFSSQLKSQENDGADNISLFMVAARSSEANMCPKYLWWQVYVLIYLQFQDLPLVASFPHLNLFISFGNTFTDASIEITYTLYSSFCNHPLINDSGEEDQRTGSWRVTESQSVTYRLLVNF